MVSSSTSAAFGARPTEGQHLPLAPAERPGELRHPAAQHREHGDDPVSGSFDLPLAREQVSAQCEVLSHGKVGERPAALGHVAHAKLDPPSRPGGQRDAIELQFPRRLLDEAGDTAQERRLACGVGSHQRDKLARINSQADRVQDLQRTISSM
jgi:hypothetical protein